MLQINTNSKQLGAYPSPFVSPEKKASKEFIQEYLQQMYHDWKYAENSVYKSRVKEFEENRKYARGEQNYNKYKDLLAVQGDKSYLNMDWSIVSIIPKFLDVIVGGLTNQDYKVICTAVDPTAVSQRRKDLLEMKLRMETQPMVEQFAKQHGMDLNQGRFIPENDDDLDLYMSLNYKQAAEIAMEQGVGLAFFLNQWIEIRKSIIEDLVICGLGAVRCYTDKNLGPQLRYIEAERFVYPYSQKQDFANIDHAGEIMLVSIGELKRMANGEFSEKEFVKIAESVRGQYGNTNTFSPSKTDSYGSKEYDKMMVEVLDGEFLSTDTITYEKKGNSHGNSSYHKKGANYKKPKTSKYKREVNKVEVKNAYKGKLIVGTDYIFDYGKVTNMPRSKSRLTETKLSFISYSPSMRGGKFKSLVARMRPFADQIQLTHLKIQQLIAKARPKGLMIEVGGLENINIGDGNVLGPLEIQEIFDQTGNFYYRRLSEAGEAVNYKPIEEIENGIGKDLQSLVAIYNYNLERIRDVTGVNEVRDASQPSRDALVGVQKLALMASNNATRGINDGLINITQKCASQIVLRLQHLVKYKGPYKGYISAIGESAMQAINVGKEITYREFGIKIEALPDEEERQLLEANIQQSIAQKELRIEDAITVRAIKNVKLANQMLILRRKKYQEDMAKMAQANAENNARQQQASVQAAAQAEQQRIQADTQSKVTLLEKEYELKGELSEKQHQMKMDELQLTNEMGGDREIEKYDREKEEKEDVEEIDASKTK